MVVCSSLVVFRVCYHSADKYGDATLITRTDKASETIVLTNAGEKITYEEYAQSDFYILNTNSKKIHIASCGIAKNINENNYAQSDNLQYVLESGYTPCGICMPSE